MRKAVSIAEILKDMWERMERYRAGKMRTSDPASGLRELDRLTGGFHPRELTFIAGRPAMGKSAFLLNLLRHAALEQSLGVILYNMHADVESVCFNLLCAEAQLDIGKLRSAFLPEAEYRLLILASDRLAQSRIFVNDSPILSIADLASQLRHMKRMHKLDLCLVDSFQLLRPLQPAGTRPRTEDLAETAWALKYLAMELSLPLVVASSMNRGPEYRGDHRPMLSDLDTAEIEEAADTVILLHRPEYYDYNSCPGLAELIVAKHRNGPTGVAHVNFQNKYLRFTDFSEGSNNGREKNQA